jgi:hypothetical protein
MKPSLLLPALKHLINIQRPVFLWGAPGVGKSDLIKQVADDMKVELKDVRLSLMDPTDLKGFPTQGKSGTKAVMSWLQPDFLPTKGKGILFLDEMNSAPQSVQAAAYQLILNRKIGDYELPKGWTIVAAGNRTGDRSVVHAQPAALSNRFIHLDYDVDTEDWVDWAIKNGISDATRGYIRYRPANLCVSKIEVGMRAFPSPRTWAFADSIINSDLDAAIELELLKGTIGEGVAAEYMGFLRESKNLPNLDRILIDPEGVKVPESPSTCYALISALETRTDSNNFGTLMKYIKRMSKEFEVVFATSVVKRDEGISETKAFTEWIRENRNVLIG